MSRVIVRNLLFILVISTILFFILKERSPFGKSNSSFGIDQKNEITKIEFSEGSSELSLEKNGKEWLINGKGETRKSSILFILRVLKEIQIKSPVNPEMFRTEIIEKGIKPVHVKIYGNFRLLNSYLVYKTGSNIYGNIMKKRERSKPFIVYIPGYEADIGSAFVVNKLFWQPFTVFNMLPSHIESVNVEYINNDSSSFTITKKNHRYVVSGIKSELSGWDSSRVMRYLTYFTWIPFEAWAFDVPPGERQRIESEQPLIRITVTGTNGVKTILTLWEREKIKNGILTKDSDRLWGQTNNNDELFIIRYFDVDPILKKRSYLFPE